MTKFYQQITTTLILFLFNSAAFSQEYKWSKGINDKDSGQITAQTIYSNGDIYIASQVSGTGRLGGFGLNGTYDRGEIVLSKFNANGDPIWSKNFPKSDGRIFKMQTTKQGDLIIAGGFYDSISLDNKTTHRSSPYVSQSFMAKFDSSGTYLWSKTSWTSTSNLVCYTFALSDTNIIVAGKFSGFYPSIRKLNSYGVVLDSLELGFRFGALSDLAVDKTGNIYICGGASPNAKLDTVTIKKPYPFSSYLNFIAKLSPTFKGIWMHSTNNITLNLDPELELFDDKVAFISSKYSEDRRSNKFEIDYLNLSGTYLGSDSITVMGSHAAGKTSLSSHNNTLYVIYPKSKNDVQIRQIEYLVKDTIISVIECETLNNFPKLLFLNNDAFLTSSFRSAKAILHGDTIKNAKAPHFLSSQQMIAKYQLKQCKIDISVVQTGAKLEAKPNADSYQWLDCNNNYSKIPNQNKSIFISGSNGRYAVEIVKGNCRDTSMCYTINSLGLQEQGLHSVSIYPNPTKGKFHVGLSQTSNPNIIIYDAQGRIIQSLNNIKASSIQLEITNPKGLYFIEIISEEGRSRSKLMKY